MSTTSLRIFPKDMEYIPHESSYPNAKTILETMFEHGEIDFDTYDDVIWMDLGDYLESVFCPRCITEIKFDYFKEDDANYNWWISIPPAIEDVPAKGVIVTMPCCSTIVDFTSLTFNMSSGFARFAIFVWDVERVATTDQILTLEKILGCELKQMLVRY